MDRTRRIVLAWTAVAIGFGYLATAGDLNPPAGPVAPTFKTLNEVEPRRAISQADVPITITESGSYYLTEDLVATSKQTLVTITAPHVELDLRGFAIDGQGVGLVGILFDDVESLRVHNGAVRDFLGNGITALSGTTDASIVVHDMLILANGSFGIEAGQNRLRIRDCSVHDNGNVGINAQIVHARDCLVTGNRDFGISGADGIAVNNVSLGHTLNFLIPSGVVIENRGN